jgi:cytochrome P450 family 135
MLACFVLVGCEQRSRSPDAGRSKLVSMSKAAPTTLPPGPRLPSAVQAALLYRHGSRFLAACQRRYGSVFTLRIVSIGTLVYLADPADIKTVFTGDPSVFHAGEANSILSGLLGDTSLLVIDASACGLNTTEQGLSIASQIAAKVPT